MIGYKWRKRAFGIVFWLVVVGIIAIIQRWGRAALYQTVQGKIQKTWRQSPGRWQ